MKKLVLLLSISLFLFSCKRKYSYEVTNLLASRRIPEQKAKDMKKRFKDAGKTPTRYTFDWKFYEGLATGNDDVYIMPVRYNRGDEKEYREAWGIPDGDPAGDVDGFSSFIIQVGANTEYYTFVRICPPPDVCP